MGKTKKNINILIVLLLTASCLLFFRTRLTQIFYPEDFLRSCTDFGQYLIEIQDYSQGSKNIKDLLKVAEEPGIFLIASELIRVAGLSEKSVLPILSIIMYIIIGLIVSSLSQKISFKHKNLAAILGLLIYISLIGNVSAHISGIWRQMLSQIFLLLIVLCSYYRSNMFVSIIFLSMAIISHSFSMMITIILFGFLILSNLWYKKSNLAKKNSIILVAGLTITSYYLFKVISGYIYDYAIYLIEYVTNTSVVKNHRVEGTSYYFLQKPNKYIGYSFFGNNPDNITPIVLYFLNFNLLIILLIAKIRKIVNIKSPTYIFMLLLVGTYVSIKIDFAPRALLTFELLIIPILISTIFDIKKDRNLIMLLIFISGFLEISSNIINNTFTRSISTDSSINFVRTNFKEQEERFFMATGCTSDILSQLGVNNTFNYHLKLDGARMNRQNGELGFAELQRVTNKNILFLARSPVLFDFFKDKEVYIAIGRGDSRILEKIKNREYDFLNKNYLELIYENSNKTETFRYIFKVRKEGVNYTDTVDYLSNNINLISEEEL